MNIFMYYFNFGGIHPAMLGAYSWWYSWDHRQYQGLNWGLPHAKQVPKP